VLRFNVNIIKKYVSIWFLVTLRYCKDGSLNFLCLEENINEQSKAALMIYVGSVFDIINLTILDKNHEHLLELSGSFAWNRFPHFCGSSDLQESSGLYTPTDVRIFI